MTNKIKKMGLNILLFLIVINFGCHPENKQPELSYSDLDSFNYKKLYSKEFLMGKTKPSNDTSFILIPNIFTNGNKQYLKKNVFSEYKKMHNAALKDGIKLKIVSSYRSYNEQKTIWENKWNIGRVVAGKDFKKNRKDNIEKAKIILRFSSMPGTSRHHWGSDIDINSLQNSFFEKGQGKLIYEWLNKNAYKYGFFQPYTSKIYDNRCGYEEEKWHWSYYPLSNEILNEYIRDIKYVDFIGFKGSDLAEELLIIQDYVNGINYNLNYNK